MGPSSTLSASGCCVVRGCALLAVLILLNARCSAQQFSPDSTEQTQEPQEARAEPGQPHITSPAPRQSSGGLGPPTPLVTDTQRPTTDHHTRLLASKVQTAPTGQTASPDHFRHTHSVDKVNHMFINKILSSALSSDSTENTDTLNQTGTTRSSNHKKSASSQMDCSTILSATTKSTTVSSPDSLQNQSHIKANWAAGSLSEKPVSDTRSVKLSGEHPLKVKSCSREEQNTTVVQAEAVEVALRHSGDQNSTRTTNTLALNPKTSPEKSRELSTFQEDVMSVRVLSAQSHKPAGYNIYENFRSSGTMSNRSQGAAPRGNVTSNIRVFEFSERSRLLEEDDEAMDSDISRRKLSEAVEEDEESIVRDCTLIIVFSCVAVLVLIVCKAVRYFLLWRLSKREEQLQVFTVSGLPSDADDRTLSHDKSTE